MGAPHGAASADHAKRSARDVDELTFAVVRERLALGDVRSITGRFEPAVIPVHSVCLGMKDGSDPSDALLKALRQGYQIFKLSECADSGLGLHQRLVIDPVRWRGDDEAEVTLEGLGMPVGYKARRQKDRWQVIAPIGGIVG
jgi:hypothetical protein